MKCPRRFKIVQNIITINKDTEELRGEGRFFIESQEFEECYKNAHYGIKKNNLVKYRRHEWTKKK